MYLINIDGLSLLIGVIVACIMLGKSSPIFKVIMLTGAISLVIAVALFEMVNQ